MNQETKGRHVAAATTVLVFCLLLFFPMVAQVAALDSGRSSLGEAHEVKLPEFEWSLKTLAGFTTILRQGWLDKHFPFRGTLIRWHNYYSARIFGSMSGGSPVVVGRDGWLYLAKDRGRNVMDEHRAARPIPEDKMDAVAKVLKERQEWLAARGIAYLVAVAPNKETIYPEHLPSAYAQVGSLARIDQIVDHLSVRAGINVIDLRVPLLEAKQKERVYYFTDSHWNSVGAFVSYQALIRRLGKTFPALVPMKRENFFLERYTFLGGDLSNMMGLQDVMTEDRMYLLPKHPYRARGVSIDYENPRFFQPPQASRVDDPRLPKVVFFHDSFFWEIMPFVGEHFSRAVYVWVKPWRKSGPHVFDKALIEREKPDVVVEEIAERFLVPIAPGQGDEE